MEKSRIKILIVNDKVELRNIVRDYLKEEGYTYLSVSENGRSAWRKMVEDPPDLVVADYELPEISGLELLKRMRRSRNLAETPVILIMPETERSLVAQAAEHKVNGLIIKPFSHKVLAEKVNLVLQKRYQPTESERLYHLANEMTMTGDLDGALEIYSQALSAARTAVAAIHYKIGGVQEKLERDDEAESNYHEAVGYSGQFVSAYDALGSLNLRRDRNDEAVRFYRAGSDIAPLNAQRQIALGEALLGSGNFEDAESAFRFALDIDPGAVHAFNRLGICLRRQGRLEEALAALLRAAEDIQDDENLFYNLSRVYLDRDEKDQAVLWLRKAVEINPDIGEARRLLDEIRGRGGA